MKIIKIFLITIFIATIAYIGWTAHITFFGHTISTIDNERYQLEVRRMPYRFSFFTPIYGNRMFPGYVEMRIRYLEAREITSYSVNWDSFYPKSCDISIIDPKTFEFEFNGRVVTCELTDEGAKWSHSIR